jgi:hypothetical protein
LPDPSVVGQAVAIDFSVAVTAPGNGTPTGSVTVSDGTQSCSGTLTTGSCSIVFTTSGAKTLTATYAGNANFNGSSSTPATAHTVNKASTITTLTSDLPDPSMVGQSVTIAYSVAVTAPGSGTPGGSVTISDGIQSCSGAVADGSCSIVFATSGAKTLTATYVGDTNFTTSTSATVTHDVVTAGTTTVITNALALARPTGVGQSYLVIFSVTPSTSGTPAGNVTVSDGTDTCIGTVASGKCNLTSTTVGTKSLTATYAGDSNYNGSTSIAVPHTVALYYWIYLPLMVR